MKSLRQLAPAVTALLLICGAPCSAQSVTEWSAEQRYAVSFQVDAAALQLLLPSGWRLAPSTALGNPGGNLNVSFIDRLVVFDGQGMQYRAGSSRYVVFTVPARNAEGVANNIIVSGISPEGAGAYGVNLTATTSRVQRSTAAEAEDDIRVEERWQFAAASGERIDFEIAYRRAPTTRTRTEVTIRSASQPDLTRSYRIDQAADVLRSANTPDRIERLSLKISGPKFATLFDGSEELLSVTAFPYFVREIYSPALAPRR